MFTARPGMGKTYALRCFMNGLNPNQYQTAYICLSTVSVTEFYRQFCDILGLEACGNKTGMFHAIQERLYYLYKEKKQPFLLAVDEAQYLNYSILRDLKMLMNYSYDSLNCFSLILVGEPYLNHILENRCTRHSGSASRCIITMRGCRIRRFRSISATSWSWRVEAGASFRRRQ